MDAAELRGRSGGQALAVLLALSAALFGCADERDGASEPPPAVTKGAEDESEAAGRGVGDAPLQNGRPSLEAIGQAIVEGLNASDEAALRSVLVDAGDFKGRLFAALSNHPSAAQMGPDLVWELQQREGADELARALRRHGGQRLRFQALRPGAREERGEQEVPHRITSGRRRPRRPSGSS